MAPMEKADLLQGTLDMLILKVVATGRVHGYGISLRIRQISDAVLQVQQGSLYPALHRLEKRGWLQADWGESENGRQAQVLSPFGKRPKAVGGRRGNLEPAFQSSRADSSNGGIGGGDRNGLAEQRRRQTP